MAPESVGGTAGMQFRCQVGTWVTPAGPAHRALLLTIVDPRVDIRLEGGGRTRRMLRQAYGSLSGPLLRQGLAAVAESVAAACQG